jgi:prophage regulatory protein
VLQIDLPALVDDRFLSKPEVLRIAGFSAATLWREVKASRFPEPVRISSNRIGFLESEVREWVASKVRASRQRHRRAARVEENAKSRPPPEAA